MIMMIVMVIMMAVMKKHKKHASIKFGSKAILTICEDLLNFALFIEENDLASVYDTNLIIGASHTMHQFYLDNNTRSNNDTKTE